MASKLHSRKTREGKFQREPRGDVIISGDIALIPLNGGHRAIIDLSDLPLVRDHSWHTLRSHDRIYALAHIGGRHVRMHRLITGDKRSHIDHKNRDGLDNRRSNLREATSSQNGANTRQRINNTSGFKGVAYCKQTGTWRALIMVNRKTSCLGRYPTPEAAARAYDDAAVGAFGEFARTNFGGNG